MLPKLKGPNQHFNAYYHNDAMLIQFVVSEFVRTCEFFSQLKLLAQASLQSTQSLETSIVPLFNQLSHLMGKAQDPSRLLASRWDNGPLTKLKQYCEQFTKNSPSNPKRYLTLYSHVHRAWLGGLHSLELLNVLQHSLTGPVSVSTLLRIKKAFQNLDQYLKKIMRHLPSVLGFYKDNENVLYFIFKQWDSLSIIYDAEFMNKLFKCFLKKNELPQLIIQRYIKRGFVPK